VSTEHNQSADEVVCGCTGTTYRKIQTLFEQGFDLDAICRKTGARSGCGGCEWEIEAFVKVVAELNQK
jgi:bacterioferritin-associated ferredoxin